MNARCLSTFAALLIAISTSPAASDDGVRFVNPEGLFKPSTFSQVAIAEGDVMAFISGQTARDESSNIVAVGDVQKQTDKALPAHRN